MTDKKKQGGPAYAPLPPRYYIFGHYDVWDKVQMLKYADDTHELRVKRLQDNPMEWPLPHRNALDAAPAAKFKVGDLVTKTKGSQWKGRVVGTYSTTLTPEGYAVESSTERGSVQIYPAAALELVQEARAEQSAITPESGTPPAHSRHTSGAPPAEQPTQPGAVDRTGCTAGTDEECTRRGCATSCPAAPKAAPGERCTHCGDAKELHNGLRCVNGTENSYWAAPQQKPSQDTMYLLRRLLSNQHTLTGPEFRAELEKIVGEAPQQEAREPVALLVRKNSWRAGQWETAPPDSPTYGMAWADHRQYVYAAPQPAPAPLSEREAFEAAWEKLHGKRPVLWDTALKEAKMDVPAHSAGKYFYRDAQAAWKAWQARAALAAQRGK